MATRASTDITVKTPAKDPLAVIQLWLDHGWSLSSVRKQISFLPLHDDEMFDWQSKPASEWESVKADLAEKARLGEIIGIILYWKDTAHGGQFHFNFAPGLVSINWNIDRKAHATGDGKTDLAWYEPKVVTPLLQAGIDVLSVRSEDQDSGGTVLQTSFHDAEATRRQFGVR